VREQLCSAEFLFLCEPPVCFICRTTYEVYRGDMMMQMLCSTQFLFLCEPASGGGWRGLSVRRRTSFLLVWRFSVRAHRPDASRPKTAGSGPGVHGHDTMIVITRLVGWPMLD
jgi:hypothetical protein